jgi:hypothetical protein
VGIATLDFVIRAGSFASTTIETHLIEDFQLEEILGRSGGSIPSSCSPGGLSKTEMPYNTNKEEEEKTRIGSSTRLYRLREKWNF